MKERIDKSVASLMNSSLTTYLLYASDIKINRTKFLNCLLSIVRYY